MVKEGLAKKVTCEQKLRGNERESHVDLQEEGIQAECNSMCKGPEVVMKVTWQGGGRCQTMQGPAGRREDSEMGAL